MNDFIVTAVCPKCSHVWTFPDVFEHNCPSCGTSTPAVDVELLAGRREAMERGESLPPIVAVPEEGTDLMENFTEAVNALRDLIAQEALNAEGEDQRIGEGGTSQELGVLRNYYAQRRARIDSLKSIERGISSLFLVTETSKGKFVRKKEHYNITPNLGQWANQGLKVGVDPAVPKGEVKVVGGGKRIRRNDTVLIQTQKDGTFMVIEAPDEDVETDDDGRVG